MRTAIVGYWVIFAGTILQIFGTLWKAVDELASGKILGGLLTPERLTLLGLVV
jgi:hypothetical protein